MESMHEIARAAINQMPPASHVLPEHVEIIARHRDALLALGPELTATFYDMLYSHQGAAEVFAGEDRASREKVLTTWWHRTVTGPINDDYWASMAMMGLVHVVRRITNPMMLSMIGFISSFVANNAGRLGLEAQEEARLVEAFNRVLAVGAAVIAWGFDHSVTAALFEVAGMPEALLTRLRDSEVADALEKAQAELGIEPSTLA